MYLVVYKLLFILVLGSKFINSVSIISFTLVDPESDYNSVANLIRICQQLFQLNAVEWSKSVRSVHMSQSSCKLLNKHDVHSISVELGLKLICSDIRTFKDSRIGTHQRAKEYVSTIMHSMNHSLSDYRPVNMATKSSRMLFLAISGTTTFIPSPKFYENWNGKYFTEELALSKTTPALPYKLFNIILYGKNRKFGVVSDWHDLQCVAFRFATSSEYESILGWVRVLKATYEEYADRAEFNMLEPRPAIIEANIQYKHQLIIKYWSRMFIHIGQQNSIPSTALFTLNCHSSNVPPSRRFGDPFEDFDKDICENIYDVGLWRRNIDLNSGDISHVLGVPNDQLDTRLPWGIDNGALRFRLAERNVNELKPARYCWE